MTKIPDYISNMSDERFLECLDDYGDAWHYCHEAAKRIRKLKLKLAQQQDLADGCWHERLTYGANGIVCNDCGAKLPDR